MTVRNTYGIRTSLEKGKLDSQIQFGANTGLSVGKKPITVRTLLYTFGALFLYVLLFRLVFGNGGIVGISVTTLGYILCYRLLFTRTETLDYKQTYIVAMINYWLSGLRRIRTGLLDDAAPVLEFFGIKHISEDGLITFDNGDVGVVMEVVGYASEMIFDSDRNTVLTDTRTFFKNLPTGLSFMLNTQASTQDVHEQVNSKLIQLRQLKIDSPGLRQIIKRQGSVLKNEVGEKFSMTRQYTLVRGLEDNVNSTVNQILNSAASSSNLFLKSAVILRNEQPRYSREGMPLNDPLQVERYLKSIYNGDE